MLTIEEFGKYKEEIEKKDRKKGKKKSLARGNRGKPEKLFSDVRGIEGRDRDEKVFARPNGHRDNAETAISCRRPGPA